MYRGTNLLNLNASMSITEKPDPKTDNAALLKWVNKMIEMCKPE